MAQKEHKLVILALDLGTKCGYCSNTASGTFNFKVKPTESNGMRFIKFKSRLNSLIQADKIDLIAYEKAGGRNFTGIKSHANFEGVLITWCIENNIDYVGYSATEIKKHAKQTFEFKSSIPHKGQMNKQAMIDYGKYIFEMDFVDDNHADAKWLYNLAQKQFNN